MEYAPPLTERQQPTLSVVVPAYNEGGNIDLFHARLSEVLAGLDLACEVIYVNDGSRDDTLERLRAIHGGASNVRVIDLSRNFGKEVALSAGLDFAAGDAIVFIDSDLQHDPKLIATFVERWRDGFEMVYAKRVHRKDESPFKAALTGVFYFILNRVADGPVVVDGGDFRLMDRKVAEALKRLPERKRFMKGLYAWVGFRQTAVPFEVETRHAGKTSFSFWRLWNFAIEGITSFSSAPLKVWAYLGLSVAALSFVYAAYIAFKTIIYGVDLPGYASLMVAVLFFSGLNMVGLGVIGEYLARVFIETKGRPLYVVRDDYAPARGQGRTDPPAATAAQATQSSSNQP